MKYLARLKKEENAHPDPLPKLSEPPFDSNGSEGKRHILEKREHEAPLQKLQEPPFDSFDSDPRRHISENEGPAPESVRVYSQALQREITISWHGDNPDEVFVEGKPYSLAEIAKLKELAPEAARAAHEIKTVFRGARVLRSLH